METPGSQLRMAIADRLKSVTDPVPLVVLAKEIDCNEVIPSYFDFLNESFLRNSATNCRLLDRCRERRFSCVMRRQVLREEVFGSFFAA